MTARYSRFMRSFFDVDLIAQQQILHSTPCRLEDRMSGSSGRRFSKCVRIRPDIGFNVLLMYKHHYPHPEKWTKSGYKPEWLIATVHRIQNARETVALCDSVIPYIEQGDRRDRKLMISAEDFVTSPDQSSTCIESTSQGSPTNSTLNLLHGQQTQTGMNEQSGDVCKEDVVGPYSLATLPYYGLIVRFYRAQAPEHSSSDQLLDEFQLFCFDHERYIDVYREVIQDPEALQILHERQEQLERGSRAAINIMSRSPLNVSYNSERTVEPPLPNDEVKKTSSTV